MRRLMRCSGRRRSRGRGGIKHYLTPRPTRARRLVTKAMEGDVTALKEIGDRLDGKPTQAVDLGGELEITKIERVIVNATNTVR